MTIALLIAAFVFSGTLLSLEVGFRWGRREAARGPAHEGIGAMEASSFALLGLLLAFSFSGAMSRLDTKRELIVGEANAIGTAYLRVDLLPEASQPAIRQQFSALLEARLRAYEDRGDDEQAAADLKAVATAQQRIWVLSVEAARGLPPPLASLVLPPINEMMDISTGSWTALQTRLPTLIVSLLIGTAVLSGLLAGYAMAKRFDRSWFHATVYAGLLALTVYTVLDLDRPRFGVIRIDAAYRSLIELRQAIK